ncbi:MAG: helix-turn-helix domain-containing protein [Polyangiales bacterium]
MADATLPPVTTRHCKILVVPGAFSLDVFGPFEVFTMGTRLWTQRSQWDRALGADTTRPVDGTDGSRLAAQSGVYDVELVSEHGGPVASSSDVPLYTARATTQVVEPFDTLMVAGGPGIGEAMKSASLKAEVLRLSALCRRVTSVCTGAFLLAEVGLLRGRRATTHWASCDALAELFPDTSVERAPIYTRDGNVYTSAGATAGIDLALALVREDLGSALAQEIARWLVLFVQRPGGQAQLSAALQSQPLQRRPLHDLQLWIADHPDADLTVPELAQRVGMSPRNFARAFTRELGVTPANYVEKTRLEAACQRLELGDDSLEHIALDAGFGTVKTLQRSFKRVLGVAPAEYRELRRRTASDKR